MNRHPLHSFTASFLFASTLTLPLASLGATRLVNGSATCDNTSGNPAYCTIASALAAASDGDVIEIAAGNYVEQLAISKSVSLHGSGAGVTFIDGGHTFQPVWVQDGATVQLNSLTVRNGESTGGGGIYLASGGTLSIIDCEVKGNHGGMGGGIYSVGTLTVERTRITGNSSPSWGGGIVTVAGTANIVNSTIDNNSAAPGGGIYNNSGAVLAIANTTISDNISSAGHGGALYTTGTTTFTNATVAGNTSASTYGGIYSTGNTTLQNTLVAGNAGAGGAQDCQTSGGSFVSLGHNFIATTSGCTSTAATGDLFGQGDAAAKLGSLSDNGGNTPTRALLSGSAAIDAGAGCLAQDQRGVARPTDGNGDGAATCDIGAYEAAAVPTSGNTSNSSGGGGGGGGGAGDWLTVALLGLATSIRRRAAR